MSNNKKEIQQQITATFQEIAALLAEKNLTEAALSPSFFKVFAAAQTVVNQNGTAVAAGFPDDIEKHPFATTVQNWKKSLLTKLKEHKKTYAKVKFNTKDFAQSITDSKSDVPFNSAMHEEWNNLIKKLPAETTGKVLFDALISNTGDIWSMASNFEALKKHYNKNKKVYGSYSDDIADFKGEALPQNSLFDLAIKASTDSEDEELPANKAVEEKAKKEFLDLFNEWKKELANELSSNNTKDSNYINPNKLANNLASRFEATNAYSRPIAEYLKISIREKAKGTGDSITASELKEQIIPVITVLNDKIDWDKQFEIWKKNKDKFMFPISKGIHTAIREGCINISADRFEIQAKTTILDKYLKLIDTIGLNKKWEKVNDSIEPIFSGVILKKELALALAREVNSIVPLKFVNDILAKNIPNEEYSLDQVNEYWKKSMQEAYKLAKDKKNSPYQQWLKTSTMSDVEEAIDSFDAFFPNEAILIAVLEEARVYKEKKKAAQLHSYDITNTTNFTCAVNWKIVNSILSVSAEEAATATFKNTITAPLYEYLKSYQGIKLVTEELENSGKIVGLDIPDFTFDVRIPMKLVHIFNNKGEKIVAAVPNNLDTSHIKFNGDGGYLGFEVEKIEVVSDLPTFVGGSYRAGVDSAISHQKILMTVAISEPQISVSSSAGVLGVEMGKNPNIYTLDLTMILYSEYDFKKNLVKININGDSLEHEGAGKIINSITVKNKKALSLNVFKSK